MCVHVLKESCDIALAGPCHQEIDAAPRRQWVIVPT